MNRIARAALVAWLIALPLAGCSDWDPTDLFDNNIFNPKKPLPGDRKPLFPDGTPGVQKGVPPDLYRGATPAQEGSTQGGPAQGSTPQVGATQATTATSREASPGGSGQGVTTDRRYAGAPEDAAPRPKPKPKKAQVVAAPQTTPTPITVRPNASTASSSSPWPDPPPMQSAPATNAAPTPGIWPDPPPPSTYAH